MTHFWFLFLLGISFAFTDASPSDYATTRCRRPNEVYECRYQYEWEKCEDRFNSPPFNPGTPNHCRCYCARGYWRNSWNQCVAPENCP